jgi:branched-chain amino acid transport system ATP-binding protein
MPDLLEIEDLHLSFAGVRALEGVSLSVPEGAFVAVIGPNGAGKTSLFNCISGVYHPHRGNVRLAGRDLGSLSPQRRAALGVARMFQNLALFEQLSVLDNLMLGRHHLFESRFFEDLLFTRRARCEEVRHRRACEEVLDFLHLERFRRSPVGILPYGIRKRVELGRAVCMEPRVLLLDEPAAGLNQEETEDMARYLQDLREEMGITLLLIEHELRLVMDLADRVAVLDFGRLIAEGAPGDVRTDPAVLEAYVGPEAAVAAGGAAP